jgi:hypothetical protein
MPLLDHLHPPLSDERHWESFHSAWAGEIMGYLNQGILPAGYFAETQVHLGGRVEVDVASFETSNGARASSNGGVAVAAKARANVMSMPATFPDEFEVRVIHRSGGPTLVGAIELVSPSNKDRPESRRAFATKCAAYLYEGIGLIVVDVVTDHHFNLHDELIDVMQQADAFRFPKGSAIYAINYRPVRDQAQGDQIEIDPRPLHVGKELPAQALALRNGPVVTIDLETTYTSTRKRSLL